MANIFPNFKSNVWVRPTGGPPAIIRDGNTVGWYLSDKPDTITKDGSDRVSEWADFLGSGHDLLQATGADQGLWSANGILFDGISEFLKAVGFVYNQPEQVYICFRQITWVNNNYVFDGNAAATGVLRQFNATPELALWAGAASPTDGGLILNTFGIIRILFNGAASEFEINNLGNWIGDAGAGNMAGFTMANQAGGTLFANIEVKEVILRNIADTAPNNQIIYDYLANKHAI